MDELKNLGRRLRTIFMILTSPYKLIEERVESIINSVDPLIYCLESSRKQCHTALEGNLTDPKRISFELAESAIGVTLNRIHSGQYKDEVDEFEYLIRERERVIQASLDYIFDNREVRRLLEKYGEDTSLETSFDIMDTIARVGYKVAYNASKKSLVAHGKRVAHNLDTILLFDFSRNIGVYKDPDENLYIGNEKLAKVMYYLTHIAGSITDSVASNYENMAKNIFG